MKINFIKRSISLIIVLAMTFSFSVQAMAAPQKPSLEMPEYFMIPDSDIGFKMPFKPAHMYNNTQNPPDFTWPRIEGAEEYDLIVAKDENLQDIAYRKDGLKNHYYNFPHTFEPGIYYWAVRYHIGDKISNWSAARRFRLDIDNVEFTLPEGTAIVDSFPDSHPRLWFTQDTIDEFRKRAETTQGKIAKAALIESAEAEMKKSIPDDPGLEIRENVSQSEGWAKSTSANNAAQYVCNQVRTCAMAYVLSEDTKYADFAIEVMMKVSDWGYTEGYWTAFTGNDQAYYQIVLDFSYSYDWLYNYMTPEQRKKIGDMLHGRFQYIKDHVLEVLVDEPYSSHLWSYMANYIVCAVALSKEYPDVDEYLIRSMEFFVSNYVPMCYEDGSWSKGTAYWRHAYMRDNAIPKALYVGEILDMFKKPFHRNQYMFNIYMAPVKSHGSFGDEAIKSSANNHFTSQGASEDVVFTNNPIPRWQLHIAGSYQDFIKDFAAILSAESGDVQYKAPVEHPRSWHFPDTGMTAMHSDLVATDKTSLYFRSGRYGSYNHMQCDQNAFVIEANGERLASESGWYDSYHSYHDSGFTRKTYATNSITFDHGTSQVDDDFDADGITRMFVNQADFDAVVGDATNAYKGQIGNFTRSIIYVRPDSYIVVDDLDAGDYAKSFEWWMNTVAQNDISVHEDNKGITIEAENMALYTRIYTPDKITPYYSDVYSGPDLINFPTLDRYASQKPDKRIWFETEKVKEAKFISTMNVYKKEGSPKNVTETDFGDYLKLEFEDGTVAIINKTTDNKKMINAGDVQFNGTAAVYNDDSVMLVGGNELTLYGIKLIESDKVVTVVVGKEEIGIGCDSDYAVTIYSGNEIIPEIKNVKQRMKDSIREPISTELTGVEVEYEKDGKVKINALKGHYSMYYNGKELPGQALNHELEFEVVIDGEIYKHSAPAYLNHDGIPSGYTDIVIPTGNYILVGKTDGITVGKENFSKVDEKHVEGSYYVSVTGENQRIEFKTVSVVDLGRGEHYSNYEDVENILTVKVEAEEYTELVGARHTQGLDYLTGITQLNSATSKAFYKVEIPEDGYYDIAFRYAVWAEPLPQRSMSIGGMTYSFELPLTGGWGGNGSEDFDAAIVKSDIFLKKGTHTFIIKAYNSGATWNYDWIGFIKK